MVIPSSSERATMPAWKLNEYIDRLQAEYSSLAYDHSRLVLRLLDVIRDVLKMLEQHEPR